MIRRFFPYLLTAIVVALVAAFALPPKPRVARVHASFAIAPDSSVNATALVAVNGQLQPGDSIRYKFTKDGAVLLNKVGMPPSFTANLPAPAYGQTSTYNVCARVAYANGSQSGEKCGTTPWVYTRPALPPPPATIEGVEIRPASVTLPPGATQQFCAFCRMTDRTVVMCGPQAGQVAYCDQQFQSYLAERSS